MITTTDPDEFIKFHRLITKGTLYQPFYFPLNPNSKDPLDGKSWKRNRLTPEQAVKWLQKGHNIGIAATDTDPLTIVDKDDLSKIQDAKPSLTVISRKRIGEHAFYFTSDKPVTKDIFEDSAKQNIATEDYGELRAMWQYVVCAGSYVPVTDEELKKIPIEDRKNAGKYTVNDTLPVATMTYQELPAMFKQCLQEKREAEIVKKISNENKKKPQKDNKFKSALFDLTIEDVTGKSEDSSARFASMFHGSDTGKNTSISNGVLHCWRHNVSHTPLTTLAVLAGLTECSKAGYGHKGSGSSRVDFSDGEFLFKLWIFAKKERFIPEADPIPTPALVWYATSNKLCEKDNVVDGWKLPVESYNAALDSLEKSKILPGRPKILHDSKVCGTCKFCPRGGVGGCRNQKNDVKNKKKYTVDTEPACDKYRDKTPGQEEPPENPQEKSKHPLTKNLPTAPTRFVFTVLDGKKLTGDLLPVGVQKENGQLYTTDKTWYEKALAIGGIEAPDKPGVGIKKITIIHGSLDEDPAIFRIDVEGADETTATLVLKESEILNYNKFRQKYFVALKILLPPMFSRDWENLVQELVRDAKEEIADQDEAPIINEVINFILRAKVIKDREDLFKGNGNSVWENEDSIWVSSKNLENIIKDRDITLRRLASVLSPYLNGISKQWRTKSGRVYMWPFSRKKIETK